MLTTVTLLKHLLKRLEAESMYKSSLKDLSLALIPDEDLVCIDGVFVIEDGIVMGQCVVDLHTIYTEDENILVNQIVGDIILNLEDKMINRDTEEIEFDNVTIH